jgi:hypothetical protein
LEWNAWTGSYEFKEEIELVDQLEEDITLTIALTVF